MRKKRIIYVPTHDEMMDKAIYIKLWMIYRNVIMKKTSRRKLLDDISFSLIRPDVRICYPQGVPFEFSDLDEVFGDDADMRWLGIFLEAEGYRSYPRRISNKTLRLIFLAIHAKIVCPNLAHHIER